MIRKGILEKVEKETSASTVIHQILECEFA